MAYKPSSGATDGGAECHSDGGHHAGPADHLHGGHADAAKGFSVDLAKVNNPTDLPDADKDDAVIVGISASGDVYLGSTKTDITQIADQVQDRIANKLDKTVFVKSDGRAKYGDVVKVVDEIRSAGVDNVGLMTDKAERNATAPLHRRRQTNALPGGEDRLLASRYSW